jgi:hypothetical protein
MLKFFFNRDSKAVLVAEMIGVILFAAIFLKGSLAGHGTLFRACFLVYLAAYLFIRFCALWPWYKKFGRVPKDAGVMMQFRKALVSTSYIIAVTNALILVGAPGATLYFSLIVLIGTIHVSCILIYLHLRDKDTTPPNYFSGRSAGL